MITVHHLEDSRSQRVLWLLEELGVPYQIKRYARDPKTRLAPPELRQVHPLGKSPVVTDGDRVIAETGAIVEYLLAQYGQGRLVPPDGSDEALRYRYWLHFAEGSAMPPLVMTLVFGELPKRMPALLRPVGRLIERTVQSGYLGPTITAQLDLMEGELAHASYFAGDELTGADIMMSFPVEAASSGAGLGSRPRLKTWLDTIHARPAYQAALETGGPYAYA